MFFLPLPQSICRVISWDNLFGRGSLLMRGFMTLCRWEIVYFYGNIANQGHRSYWYAKTRTPRVMLKETPLLEFHNCALFPRGIF
jgi:hypothetical protein